MNLFIVIALIAWLLSYIPKAKYNPDTDNDPLIAEEEYDTLGGYPGIDY